jgi:hypothetical protein
VENLQPVLEEYVPCVSTAVAFHPLEVGNDPVREYSELDSEENRLVGSCSTPPPVSLEPLGQLTDPAPLLTVTVVLKYLIAACAVTGEASIPITIPISRIVVLLSFMFPLCLKYRKCGTLKMNEPNQFTCGALYNQYL